MDRLTGNTRNFDGTGFAMESLVNDNGVLTDFTDKVLTKLADYEDAEEQGLILRLPCKVGDKVYRFWYVDDVPYSIQEQTIKTLTNVVAMMEDDAFGKTVFLTKEEAEQALKQMEGV